MKEVERLGFLLGELLKPTFFILIFETNLLNLLQQHLQGWFLWPAQTIFEEIKMKIDVEDFEN